MRSSIGTKKGFKWVLVLSSGEIVGYGTRHNNIRRISKSYIGLFCFLIWVEQP